MKNRCKDLSRLIICGVLLWSLIGCNTVVHKQVEKPTFNFEVTQPSIPDTIFNIIDFGASEGGYISNTTAINSAIQKCHSVGGGVVTIPKGIWLTGPIKLKSNINLHLASGALLIFSKEFNEYPFVKTYFEGRAGLRAHPLIYGVELENIAITGDGVIDGSGEAWRPVKRIKMNENQWGKLLASGGYLPTNSRIWWPNKEAYEASLNPQIVLDKKLSEKDKEKYKAFYRPPLLQLVNCKYIKLSGPTFQNSPGWNIHPIMCKHITVDNISVRNPWFSQNGDGIDLESCEYSRIINTEFDVGDDAICIKSGKNEEGRKRGMPCQFVDIQNCTVHHGHGGFVIGSEMSGGVKNIWVKNCTFSGTDSGLRFKSTRGRGGLVENIYIEDIRMINIASDAILFNMYYEGLSSTQRTKTGMRDDFEAIAVTEETPEFRNIHIKNVICQGAESAIFIQGLPEMPLSDLSITNSVFFANHGCICNHANKVHFEGLKIISKDGASFNIYNSTEISLRDNSGNQPFLLAVDGKESKNIKVAGDQETLAMQIVIGDETAESAVSITK